MSIVEPLNHRSPPASAEVKAPYSIEYQLSDPETVLAESQNDLLAVVSFGAEACSLTGDPRHVQVALEQIDGKPLIEVWRSHLPVESGFDEGIAWSRNGEALFGQLVLNEDDYPSIDAAAFDAYRRILAFQRQQGYRHALRMWNFFPDINAGEADEERYRQFSVGRARTFEQHAHFERALPAASAIGSYRSGLLVYFVAAKQPGIQIENPRQVSAFRYPREYGPKSPSFSRAKLKLWADESQLYISGTASVLGHKTIHQDDVAEQTAEIGRNFRALLDEAAKQQPRFANTPLEQLSLLRVYLRAPLQAADVQEYVQKWTGPNVPTLYLAGDICRDDLLIEIEGYSQLPAR
ncbi:MAG: hypothetical protein ACPHER_06125 [Nevskiales bacterium]